MTQFLKWSALIALAIGLLVSLIGNVYVVKWSIAQYSEQQQVRLDPTGRRHAQWPTHNKPDGVIYVGDSRIAMWTNPPSPSGVEVLNRGIGRETTAQLLLRLERDVLSERPHVVVIQCGVNDLKSIGVLPERQEQIVSECIANLRAAAERLRAAGARVVVTTVWPCGKPSVSARLVWSDATHAARAAVNHELLAWKLDGVEVVDCDDLLAESGICRAEFSLDHLHLNARGYAAVWARIDVAVAREQKRVKSPK